MTIYFAAEAENTMVKSTLLLVEDEPNLLFGMRDILELEGYDVVIARNGVEALQHLNKDEDNPPDLIVSDIMMPFMGGIELLQEVRKHQHWVTIPFIFLTAKDQKQDIHKGKLLGVDEYLVKPYDPDDLLVAIASKLSRHAALRKAQSGVIDKIKRNIMTILNHEMRTPLTLVVAYADMLKETSVETMNEDELLLFLREINTGADRLRRLIENFIYLVELETGDAQKTFKWRKTAILHQELCTIVESAHHQIMSDEHVQVMCEITLCDNHPTFIGDSIYLTVILRELLDNAVKFSQPGQTVMVKSEVVDRDIYLSVIDSGRGIPPKELANIWQTFYQINRDEFEDQGAGSGLSIVKGFAELHNAQIDVQSEYGAGSRFTVIIPAAEAL